MKKIAGTVAALLVVAGCAAPPAKVAETPSGKPEGLFRNTTTAAVSNHLVGGCAAAPRIRVSQASENRVECRGQIQGANAVVAQMLIGNSYSTPPEAIMDFTLVQQGNDVRVFADASIETIMAFGQPRRVPAEGNQSFNALQNALWRAGAERPVGA